MIRLALAVFLLMPSLALAQQIDADTLQRAVPTLEAQRNQALNQVAVLQAHLDKTKEELTKAQARIKELEPKEEPKK